jgi:hypothetical protein
VPRSGRSVNRSENFGAISARAVRLQYEGEPRVVNSTSRAPSRDRLSLTRCMSSSDKCYDEVATSLRAHCYNCVRGTRSVSPELAFYELRHCGSLGPAAGCCRSGHWNVHVRSLRQRRWLLRAGRKTRPRLDSCSRHSAMLRRIPVPWHSATGFALGAPASDQDQEQTNYVWKAAKHWTQEQTAHPRKPCWPSVCYQLQQERHQPVQPLQTSALRLGTLISVCVRYVLSKACSVVI